MNPASFCGRDEDFEFNFNLYGRKFSLDFCYQMAKTAAGNVGRVSFAANVERGWLHTKSLNIDAYYTFNHRKFSYDAPFYQFYVQKRSAGSWLAGISYQGGSIITTEDVPDSLPDIRFQTQHIGIGGGYAYNLVAGRKWLFHLSLMPNLIVWSGNRIEMNGERVNHSYKFPTVMVNGRAAIVYFFTPRIFIGINGVVNSLIKRKSDTMFHEDKWIARMFYGMRL